MTESTPLPVILLKPLKGFSALNLRDLWIYRELVFFMIWRDIKVRYKQTLLGAAWAILQPVMSMVVFTIFFGNLAEVPSDGVPYPIFTYTALLPWQLFSKALQDAARSLVANRHMITKVYFPRLVLPLSSIMAGLVDFAIALVVLVGLMIYYQTPLRWSMLSLPLFLLMALVTALGVGLWFAALNVLYRDIAYVMPFLAQFWMFITPIVYPASMVPERWRMLYFLNPMTGVVEGFRWAILGSIPTLPVNMILLSVVVSLVVLVSGLFYFRFMERLFADMV
jgi:lipopolysaccharide transport system permease protein